MMTPEDKRWVMQAIKLQLKIITSGSAGNSTMTTQDIENLMPGMPTIPARPIMHPFGFASRAPKGLIAVTAQQGENPGNKLTLGHRDKDAPDVDEGEGVAYSVGGYTIFIKNNELTIGKDGDLEHMVVGETLKTVLTALITAIVAHEHLYIPPLVPAVTSPIPTGPPINAADFTLIQTENLDTDKILAKDGGRFT
jgi:hypothetical protein